MPIYLYIIFDVDDTLLDFHSAYVTAQQNIAKELGIEYSKEYMLLDDRCGWQAWGECHLDETACQDVQKNYHQYYCQYLKKHYVYLLQELQIPYEENKLVECYLESISSSKERMERNTLEVCIKLSEQYRLLLATNGISAVQRKRISEFLPYMYKVYISEEIHLIKPTRDFYEYLCNDLHCRPKDCLMVGDSITNDMIGAKSAGMDVCFYNFKKRPLPKDVQLDFEIDSIHKLLEILP